MLYDGLQSGGKSDYEPRAASSSSSSALGLSAYRELLGRLGYSVSRTRLASSWRSFDDSVIILSGFRSAAELKEGLDRFKDAAAILVVAPKYQAVQALRADRWIHKVSRLTHDNVEMILEPVDVRLRLKTVDTVGWMKRSAMDAAPTLENGQLGTRHYGRAYAALVDPSSATMEQSVLVTETTRGSRRVFLLLDPDPVSNYGIAKGENALFAVELIERLGEGRKRIVFDESFAGSASGPTAFAKLFEWPWLALTLSFMALALVIGFAALSRFGQPKEDAVGVRAGRASLITATARLNLFEDAGRAALVRYMRHTLRTVAATRRAPGADDAERMKWLDARAGTAAKASDLDHNAQALSKSEQAEEGALLREAKRIHNWRTEMLNERD